MELRQAHSGGFALPAALFAMVVIGAIVTGGFYAATQENRTSVSSDVAREAFYVADDGIQQVRGTWTGMTLNDSLPNVGDTVHLSGYSTVSAGDTIGRYTVNIKRLDTYLYVIQSEGQPVQRGAYYNAARRRLAQAVRLSTLNMPMNAALYVNGALTVTGNAYIQGNDIDGGACNPTGASMVPGVTTSDTSQVSINKPTHVVGNPQLLEDTTMTSTSLLEYGNNVTFDSLAAQADLTFPSGIGSSYSIAPAYNGDGSCNTSLNSNWGDPSGASPPGACAQYYPMVYSGGNVQLQNGSGQGILLVNGDLKMEGNFTFAGIVVVKGSITTTGTGNHIEGVTIVNNGAVDLGSDASFSSGNSVLQYSSCAAQRAALNRERIVPITHRSWFDLTAEGAPS